MTQLMALPRWGVVMTDEHREYATATAAQLLRELRARQGTTLHECRHLHLVPPPQG